MDEERGQRRVDRAQMIAAAAATLTAVVAVVIAIWDNVQTRKHNQLSVLPFVVIERVQHDSGGQTAGVINMSNEGVGPAVLDRLEITLPTPTGRDTTMTEWGAAVPFIRAYGVEIRGWADVIGGRALGVQRSTRLLHVVAPGPEGGARVQRFLEALRLRVTYTSIYGERNTATLGIER